MPGRDCPQRSGRIRRVGGGQHEVDALQFWVEPDLSAARLTLQAFGQTNEVLWQGEETMEPAAGPDAGGVVVEVRRGARASGRVLGRRLTSKARHHSAMLMEGGGGGGVLVSRRLSIDADGNVLISAIFRTT